MTTASIWSLLIILNLTCVYYPKRSVQLIVRTTRLRPIYITCGREAMCCKQTNQSGYLESLKSPLKCGG